jgi:hypothetical protein
MALKNTRVDEYTKRQKAQTKLDFEGFMQQQAREDKEVGAAEIGGYKLGQGLVRGLFNKFAPSDELKKARGMDEREIEIFKKYPDIEDPELYKALGQMHLENNDIEEAMTYAVRANQFEKLAKERQASTVSPYADAKTTKVVKNILQTEDFQKELGINLEAKGTESDAFQGEISNRLFNIREQAEKRGSTIPDDAVIIKKIIGDLETEGRFTRGKKTGFFDFELDKEASYSVLPNKQVGTSNPVPPAVAPNYNFNNQPNLFKSL